MGIDVDNTSDAAHGRHIYQSDDGGATYRPVVDEAPGVKLINGPVMAAHPTNRDVLYFIFGTHMFSTGRTFSATTQATARCESSTTISMTERDRVLAKRPERDVPRTGKNRVAGTAG